MDDVDRARKLPYARTGMQGVLADPWTVAQIDAAIAPYAQHLPPAELAWMRERLAEALTEGRGADLLRRAHPRVVERSGEVRVSAAPASAAASPAVRRGRAG